MSPSKQVRWLKAFAVAAFATLAIPLPGRAADRVTGYFSPFKDFSVSVRDLEAFAKDGKINKIEPVQRNDAHRLIEECMLSANVACARFLKKYNLNIACHGRKFKVTPSLVEIRRFCYAVVTVF